MSEIFGLTWTQLLVLCIALIVLALLFGADNAFHMVVVILLLMILARLP